MAASLLSLNMLVLLAASSNIACYLLLALAHLKGRRAGLTGTKGFRSPLFPLIPVLSLVLIAGMTVAQFMDAQSGRPALLITVAVLAAGWLYYRLVLRRRPGGWRLSGPADIVGPGAETRAGDGAVGVAQAAE
jgi:L-asparagine transporter-like permease